MSRVLVVAACIIVVSIAAIMASASSAPLTTKLRSQQNRAKLAKLRAEGKITRFSVPRKEGTPFMQPARLVIQISNFCMKEQQFLYDEWSSDMSAGAFEVAPAPVVASEQAESFVAVHDPVGLNISGHVLYYFDSEKSSGILDIMFAAVKDEYELEVSYETKEDVALVGAVSVGKSAMYNLVIGADPYAGPSVC